MNMAEDRLGPKRVQGAYAWRKLINAGVRLAGGSDFPVELPNPFYGLYAAVTRQDREGHPPGGWYPEQRVTLAEAVRAYTLGSAIAAGVERDLGDLDIGKRADLVVLSSDVFREPPEALLQTRVDATVVDGEVVYSAL